MKTTKTSITLAELKQLIDSKNNIMLIDVRSREEYLKKHIPAAENIPVEVIEADDFLPGYGKILVTVCGKGGGRSERAADYLRKRYNNVVYFLEGGTFSWADNYEKNKDSNSQ